MTSRPVGQEGHCFFNCCSSPWPRKEFDWNGDVATQVDMRTTKVKLFEKLKVRLQLSIRSLNILSTCTLAV